MAFRLKLNEPAQKCIRRISREQFNIAASELAAAAVMPDGVHQTRKVLKRMRTLIRLIGPAIGSKEQRKRNAALRDIGRMLAGRREQAVLVATLAKLAALADTDAAEKISLYQAHLAAPHFDLCGALDTELAARVKGLVAAEAKAFSKLKVKGKGFKVIGPGLVGTYQKGLKALRRAYDDPNDENFHELRKMVQAHWRHMSLIAKAWPESLDVRISAARELSEVLGDDHDLAALITHVRADAALDAATAAAILSAARARQAQLRERARPHLLRLFAESPKAFGLRMAAYWEVSKDLQPLRDLANGEQAVAAGAPAALPLQKR